MLCQGLRAMLNRMSRELLVVGLPRIALFPPCQELVAIAPHILSTLNPYTLNPETLPQILNPQSIFGTSCKTVQDSKRTLN